MNRLKRVLIALIVVLFAFLDFSTTIFAYSRTEPYISYDSSLEYTNLSEKLKRINKGYLYRAENAYPLKVEKEKFGPQSCVNWNAYAILKVRKVTSKSYYWESEFYFPTIEKKQKGRMGITFTTLEILEKYSWGVSDEYDVFSNDIEHMNQIIVVEYYTVTPEGEILEFYVNSGKEVGGYINNIGREIGGYYDNLSSDIGFEPYCHRSYAANIESDVEYIIYLNCEAFYDKSIHNYLPLWICQFPRNTVLQRLRTFLCNGADGASYTCEAIPYEYLPSEFFMDYEIIDFTEERYNDAVLYLKSCGYENPSLGKKYYGESFTWSERYAFNIVEIWEALNEPSVQDEMNLVVNIVLATTTGVIILGVITVGIILRKRKTAVAPTEPTPPTENEPPPEI